MSNIELSIIIVSYNVKELLKQCLDSIKKNIKDVNYEIILVDNNSNDGSPEMVEKYFPEITLIRNNDNLGFAKANNQGIKIARGDYILLVNSDTKIISNNIKDLIDYMDKNPKVGILGPKIFFPNGNLQTSVTIFPTIFTVFAHHFKLKKLLPTVNIRKFFIKKFKKFLGKTIKGYLRVYEEKKGPEVVDGAMSAAFVLIRKKIFDEIGYLDKDFFMYSEDADFQLRAERVGWKTVYYPGFEVIHYLEASSKGNPLVLTERYRSSLIYWHKHHSGCEVFIVRMIMFLSFGLRCIFCRDKAFKKAYWQILKYTVHNIDYIKSHRVLGI